MSLATSPPAVSADHDLADETLAKRVRLFLETLRLAVLRRVQIRALNGSVFVEDTVQSYYDWQLAIACIRRVAGVREVIDGIHVCNDASASNLRSLLPTEVLPS